MSTGLGIIFMVGHAGFADGAIVVPKIVSRFHPSATTAIALGIAGKHGLLGDVLSHAAGDEDFGFKRGRGTEGPAASAVSLIDYGGYPTLRAPVKARGEVHALRCLDYPPTPLRSLKPLFEIRWQPRSKELLELLL